MSEETRRMALAVLAGETVLGTLDIGEIEDRLRDDPVFQEESAAWRRRLAPLLSLPREVAPGPDLWSRIAAETGLQSILGPSAETGPIIDVMPVAIPAPEDRTAAFVQPASREPAEPQRRPVLDGARASRVEPAFGAPAPVIDFEHAVEARTQAIQRRLALWRRTAVGSGALAACLAIVVGIGAFGLHRAGGSRFIGVVDAEGGVPPLVVSLDTSSGELMVRPVGMQAMPGKSHELWALPPGGQPVSLGVVDQGGHRPMSAMPMGTWRDPNLVLAVSVEPQGGSPTGQPTGPVVYKGKLIPAE